MPCPSNLKIEKKAAYDFLLKIISFHFSAPLEALLQQERGLSAWNLDASSNEGLEQVLGRCVFFETVTGSLCDVVATLKHVMAKY